MNFAKFLRTPFFIEQFQWLLLLLDEIKNIKTMKTQESKERKFEKNVREIVVFAFLSSTVEVGRWKKLNEMFVFGIFFICYV